MSRSKCVFALLGSSLIAQLVCAQTASAQLQAKAEAPTDQAAQAAAPSSLTITGSIEFGDPGSRNRFLDHEPARNLSSRLWDIRGCPDR